jgi:hypothetical protein
LAHDLWARLPALLRGKGYQPDHPLIVTTNYDDLMERALQEVGQPYDLVSYVAEGEQLGKFLHWHPTGAESTVIERPREYVEFAFEERPVVLKIHGAVDRSSEDWERDSYVITEDHYIEYLTRTDIRDLIPAPLLDRLTHSNILFLGYSLSDWNLRAILHRIWGEQKLGYTSWAVQLDPDWIESESWGKRGVDIVDIPLQEYVSRLEQKVQGLPEKRTPT